MSRLFIGVPISNNVRERIIPLLNSLKEIDANLNIVPPGNLHFTVKYLGETNEEKEVKKKLKTIQNKKFSIKLKSVSVFPSLDRINVIWIGAEGDFIPLMKEVNQELDHIRKNDHPEEVPHLTIARVKTGRNRELLQKWLQENQNNEFGEMEINKIILYKSELTPKGLVYTVLEEFPLQ
tara:strand:+ start:205 stop:741 length:537 start_codon:yes stop_codon:yes gene_type:complete